MPEGPEVRTIRDVIATMEGDDIYVPSIISHPSKDHKFIRNGISGWDWISDGFLLEKAKSKGKCIVIDVRTIHKNRKMSIINTLGMSGTWIIDPNDYTHVRVVFNGKKKLAFKDTRSFGTLKVVTREEGLKKFKKIGWDLLNMSMPMDAWMRIQDSATGKTPIGSALMKQNKFSGIGNIYKSEILYRMRLDPRTTVGMLYPNTWGNVNYVAHDVLIKAYRAGGSSVQSYTANGKKGSNQNNLLIYKKKKCPMGHDTHKLEQSKRTTWWCPACQTRTK